MLMDSSGIEVVVDSDRMNAFVVLNSEAVSLPELLNILKSNGIKFGLRENKLKETAEKPILKEPILVASGIPPVDGENAVVKNQLGEEKKEKRPVLLENGTVDYKEVHSYSLVKPGEILMIKIPATKGKKGMDVFGNEIPAKDGKDLKLVAGKNTEISKDGSSVLSLKNGIPIVHDSLIEVSEYLEIKGDVDYSTGNVDFPGDVDINGGVRPTFVVKANGNVNVKGVIEAATVSSKTNINCLGIKGKNRGLVCSGGDLHAKFLENARVESSGSVYIAGSIVNSTIRAGGTIDVSNGSGQIIGSNVIAGRRVAAKEIGSPVSISTHIEVGVNPVMRDKLTEISSKIYLDKENLDKVSRIVTLLGALKKKNNGVLPPEKAEAYTRAKKTQYDLYQSLTKLVEEMKETQKELELDSEDSSVIVTSKMYPGVEIVIGDHRVMVEKELGPSEIKISSGEIVIVPYIPS